MSEGHEADFELEGTDQQALTGEGDGFSMAEYFVRLYEYDRWANGLLLDAMDGLGEDLPAKPVNRMSHLIACQRLWMARMGWKMAFPTTVFPEITLAETHTEARLVFAEMRDFVSGLRQNNTRIFARFFFDDLQGQARSALIYEILTQLSQHGCYHRGQMAVDLNSILSQPISTDWVYYVWRQEK